METGQQKAWTMFNVGPPGVPLVVERVEFAHNLGFRLVLPVAIKYCSSQAKLQGMNVDKAAQDEEISWRYE
jgi:hypothetical protein